MGLRINTNVASLNAQRNLFNTGVELNKALGRLSSGLRINRAGDDAAGLAISESLRADTRALQQASRNANDGISMVQTAEGALNEVSNIMIRLRELAQQAATETVGVNERVFLDGEFQALLSEVSRIGATTEFNGSKLLDGSSGSLDIYVGIGDNTSGNDALSISFSTTVSASALSLTAGTAAGAVSLTGADNTNAVAVISKIEAAISSISGIRADFGAVQNRLESTVRNLGISVENLSAANSRIRDVDVAAETANLTSLQILQQAGISVLAQANLSPQAALSLLG